MSNYLSTFLSGTSEIVSTAMQSSLDDVEIDLLLDGLVTYQTTQSPLELSHITYFNNTFILLKQVDDLGDDAFKPMFDWAKQYGFEDVIPDELNFETFRIMAVDKNQMISMDKQFVSKLEKTITRETGLAVDRLHPDTELWFLYRSEGYGFVLFRLTNDSRVEHRSRGQLRPELANLMCVLATPHSGDVILDPFAGHGTIVNELVDFPHQKIIAYEKENNLLDTLDGIETVVGDFFTNNLEAGSINKIITDPPWGVFNDTLDTQKFYHDMFTEFDRLLADDGEIVLLFDRQLDPGSYLASTNFKTKETYDVLVSGKKATIYKFRKGEDYD